MCSSGYTGARCAEETSMNSIIFKFLVHFALYSVPVNRLCELNAGLCKQGSTYILII